MFSCGGCGGQSNSANHNSPLLCTGRRFTKPNQTKPNTAKENVILFRPAKNQKGRADRFFDDLPPPETVEEATDASEWLTPEEFLQKHCMTRVAFNWVLSQIEDNKEFTTAGNIRKGRPQAPAVHQLMVFLKHIGTEGAGSNSRNQRQMLGIGQGTADVCRDRVMRAILKLRPTYCTWPNKDERKKLSKKVKNVVGIADGT